MSASNDPCLRRLLADCAGCDHRAQLVVAFYPHALRPRAKGVEGRELAWWLQEEEPRLVHELLTAHLAPRRDYLCARGSRARVSLEAVLKLCAALDTPAAGFLAGALASMLDTVRRYAAERRACTPGRPGG